jgi:GT2 family glycosyltransferase
MTLTVLIVNWNSNDFLRGCLKSLGLDGTEKAIQVVVVDGGSFDGCGEMLAREFPFVEFVQSETNIGFARANNLGFRRARGDVLALLNPDTEVGVESLQTLATELRRLPRAGIVGPRLLNSDGTLQTSCVQAVPTPLNRALDSAVLHRLFPKSRLWQSAEAFAAREPVVVEGVSGACLVIESALYRAAGGFTPDYFMYAEDMDLCLKVRRLGRVVYHVPHVQVMHHGGGSSSAQFSKFKSLATCDALHTFMRVNYGRRQAACYRLAMGLSALSRMPFLGVRLLTSTAPTRGAARTSVLRWWTVLRWALGRAASPQATPRQIPSRQTARSPIPHPELRDEDGIQPADSKT